MYIGNISCTLKVEVVHDAFMCVCILLVFISIFLIAQIIIVCCHQERFFMDQALFVFHNGQLEPLLLNPILIQKTHPPY